MKIRDTSFVTCIVIQEEHSEMHESMHKRTKIQRNWLINLKIKVNYLLIMTSIFFYFSNGSFSNNPANVGHYTLVN